MNEDKKNTVFSWFKTRQGRLVVRIFAGVVSCGAFAVPHLAQTLFLDNYRDFSILRRSNKPVKLTPHLEELWTETINDVPLREYQKKLVNAIIVPTYEPTHVGSLRTKFGSFIGLPFFFNYIDLKEALAQTLMLNGEPISSDCEAANKIYESLVLSDDAKKYAIAQAILLSNNQMLIIQSAANCITVLGAYFNAQYLNDKFLLFKKPIIIRFSMYALVASLAWGIWTIQKELLFKYYENEVHETLSKFDINYIIGAIEYYTKGYQRFISMLSLQTGKIEESIISDDYMDNKTLKEIQRWTKPKVAFEKKLKELNNIGIPKKSTIDETVASYPAV